MSLNLIKVNTAKGYLYLGVGQIVNIRALPDGCEVTTADGMKYSVLEQASAVAELCNRRPPDGN